MKVPTYIVPILVIAALAGGYLLQPAFTKPTTSVSFVDAEKKAEVVCIVEGLKCKGTAGYFTKLVAAAPGIVSITTYAAEHKAIIVYDEESLTPDDIIELIEQPGAADEGVFKCMSMKVASSKQQVTSKS